MKNRLIRLATSVALAALSTLSASGQSVPIAPTKQPPHQHAAKVERAQLPDTYARAIAAIDARLLKIDALIKSNGVIGVHPEAEAIADIAGTLARLALKPDSGVPKERVKEINLTAKELAGKFDPIDKAGDSGDTAGTRKIYEEMVALQVILRKYAPASGAAEVQADASYFCPMRCEGAKTYPAPGRCPVCGMNLKKLTTDSYSVDITPDGGPISVGKPTTLSFVLKDPSVAPVTQLETVHEKLLHLLMVSNDLSWYSHEHPVLRPDATFTLQFTFPHAGAYTLFYDFTPLGVGQQIVQTPLMVGGASAPAPVALSVDVDRPKTIDGYTIALDTHGPITSGGEVRMTYAISRDGKPITDLQPYLGALGHLVIISQDLKSFVHSHPHEEAAGHSGPEVEFAAHFLNPGLYKGWAQFQHNGSVITAPFTFEVSPGEGLESAPPHEHNHSK